MNVESYRGGSWDCIAHNFLKMAYNNIILHSAYYTLMKLNSHCTNVFGQTYVCAEL